MCFAFSLLLYNSKVARGEFANIHGSYDSFKIFMGLPTTGGPAPAAHKEKL